jgi:flagellin
MLQGIGHNLNDLLALRYHRMNAQRLSQSLYRLATGQRINRASDDPAGLIASEQLRSTLVSLDAESRSLERVDYQAATADGALQEVSNLLTEAKSLALANSNDAGLSDAEKQANQIQLDSILGTVDRISRTTSFNGTKLLDGSFALTVTNKQLPVESVSSTDLGKMTLDGTTYTLGDLKSGGSLQTTSGTSETAGSVIDAAQAQISTLRGRIGSFQKHTIRTRLNSIDVAYASISAAQSQIRDLDYALEASRKARFELLRQTSLILSRPSPLGGRLDLRA